MVDQVELAKLLTNAQRRRLQMLADVPQGSERCRAFSGHGYAACVALVQKGLAFEVGKHGLGGAFQITPKGSDTLRTPTTPERSDD